MADFASFDTSPPRDMTAYEQKVVEESLREFAQLQAWRSTFASHWEEVSELIDPNSRNTFYYGNFNWPGQKKTERQIDATGMMALGRFGAICDSLLTPRNMFWHQLAADNTYLMKQRGVQLYFEQATKTLFKYRYKAKANFVSQNQGVYRGLGAYGTASMFIDAYDGSLDGERGLRYKMMPVGEVFLKENHQGVVVGFIRWYKMTAQQAYEKWGATGTFPAILEPALKSNSPMLFDFLHRVCPRTDYQPDRLDYKRMPWASYYISLQGKVLLSEGGYHTMPAAITRYCQSPWEQYGRSPAMDVLPSLKTLNAEKTVFLRQGHKAADPVYFTADDGVVDASLRPGAMNKGGMNADGRLLIGMLPTGQIQVTETMMAEERNLINDAFLVSLFQVLTETPTMTATEVIERTNEKGILLAPTVGRQQDEYLGPMIERELAVLSMQNMLPPMPPVMREARGEYQIVYTSPLSRAMRAQEAAGFIRTVETVKELVGITGDPSLLDPFDFDTAVPAIADIQSVPPSWMSSEEKIARKRQNRAAAQERQQQIQEAPAKAAMMKAQAAVVKAGAGNAQPPMTGQLPAEGGPPLAQQLGG